MGGKGLIAHLVVVMCIDNVPHLLCSSLSDTSTHPVGMLAGWIGRHRKPPVQLQMHPGARESTKSKDSHLYGKSVKVHYSTGQRGSAPFTVYATWFTQYIYHERYLRKLKVVTDKVDKLCKF